MNTNFFLQKTKTGNQILSVTIKRKITMEPDFICQGCGKKLYALNERVYNEVYKDKTLCVACRKVSGMILSPAEHAIQEGARILLRYEKSK